MSTAEMVGSMGLTFFCNKCVEVLHDFGKTEESSHDLMTMCETAKEAFQSLKWPSDSSCAPSDKVALFNTTEEVNSVARVLTSNGKKAENALNSLIDKIEVIENSNESPENRKDAARELQSFFDTLGEYSFCATMEHIRNSGGMVGI